MDPDLSKTMNFDADHPIERRDQDRAAGAPVAEEARGEEVDHALPPTGSLYDEPAGAAFDEGGDGFELAWAKARVGFADGLSEKFKRLLAHGRP